MFYYCSDKKFYDSKEKFENALKYNHSLRILYSANTEKEITDKYLQYIINETMPIEEVAKISKLQAVKMYMQQHGCQLKEAYDAVNKMV